MSEIMEWWWNAVETHWDDLIALIDRFHPLSDNPGTEYPITAAAPETMCELVRNEIRAKESGNPCDRAKKAKQDRNGDELHQIFNQTWFGMPESADVRYEPGFGILCDLCSEYEPEGVE